MNLQIENEYLGMNTLYIMIKFNFKYSLQLWFLFLYIDIVYIYIFHSLSELYRNFTIFLLFQLKHVYFLLYLDLLSVEIIYCRKGHQNYSKNGKNIYLKVEIYIHGTSHPLIKEYPLH